MISSEAFQTLLQYTKDIHDRERDKLIKKDVTDTELVLSDLASLIEEVGELGGEVRKQLKLSFNQKKVDAAELEDVYLEGIDVLICTLLLLRKFPADSLDEFIIKKIGKNDARGY
ncbi:MAG: hypothetical protein ACK4NC_04390 [Candidatus Gracilibacteria bacterium]